MKQLIIIIIVLLVFTFSGSSFCLQIYSNGTGGGDWDQPTTWQGGVVPTSADDVFIASGDSVNVPSGIAVDILVQSLTIQSNAKLANSIATTGVSLSVTNTFTIASNGWYYANGSTVTSWPSSGSYSINNASNYVQTPSGSSTIGQTGRSTFGNLINAKTGSGSVAGADLLINGNLIIMTGGTGTTFRGTNSTIGVNQTHYIAGNVYVISGQWVATDAPGSISGLTGIWNIGGNVTVGDASAPSSARMGPFASSDGGTHRVGIFNIAENLSITNGARLQAGSSSSSSTTTETGIINIGGNFSTDATAIYATNSKGLFAINFVGGGTQIITLSNQLKFSSSSNPVTVNDTVAIGSSVTFNSGQTWTCGHSSGPGANGYGSWIVNGSIGFSPANDTIIGYQDFTLNSGATFTTAHENGIGANVQTSGTITYSPEANYTFNGSGTQVTGALLPSTVNDITINNSTGVTLSADVTVNGTLTVNSGDLHLDGKTVTLSPTAILLETAGNTVTDVNGKIITTRNINAPTGLNVGGMGAMLTTSANLSSTIIERYHFVGTGNSNQGMFRVFNIVPTNNTGLNATLRFYYDESELNSIAEPNLRLFKSPNGANNSWTFEGGTANPAQNYVELTGIGSFSFWTLADINQPIPVELASFTAVTNKDVVMLNWTTATETNNSGWDIERQQIFEGQQQGWQKIGFVKGSGTSTSYRDYSFKDKNITSGKYQYRLQQIDYDGTSAYSDIVEVEVNLIPEKFALYQNYPNPFNPTTVIKFDVPSSAFVNISVFNTIGEKVATLINGQIEAGVHFAHFNAINLTSGIYIYRLTTDNNVFTNKMMLIK